MNDERIVLCCDNADAQQVDLQHKAAQFLAMRVGKDTAQAYTAGVNAYLRFTVAFGYQTLPASDQVLALFLAFQSQSCNSDSLSNYLSHIRDLHLRSGYPWKPVKDRWLISSTLKGIARMKGKQKKKKMAITVDMLRRMAVVINDDSFAAVCGIPPTNVRTVWSAILIGFFGMLRKQNICSKAVMTFDPKKSLIRGDLKWIPSTEALWFRARFSKTNLFGEKEHVIPLQYNGGPLCPVLAFFRHLEDTPGGIDNGPAFLMSKRGQLSPLSHAEFVSILKKLLEFIGENPRLFAGHSLRRGGATLGFKLGAPTCQIMTQGDWMSMAVLGYNDPAIEFVQCLPRMFADATR
jgi:hypothetical protein